jgi:hypothetical protein
MGCESSLPARDIYKYLIHRDDNVRTEWRTYLKQCYVDDNPGTNSTSKKKFPKEIPRPPPISKEKKRLLLDETWPEYVKKPETYSGSNRIMDLDDKRNEGDKACEIRETSILNEATINPDNGLLTYLLDEPEFKKSVVAQLNEPLRYFTYKGGHRAGEAR